MTGCPSPGSGTCWPAGKTRIRNTIKARSPRLAAKVTNDIWAALEAQTLVSPAETTWGEVITDLVTDLERIQTRRAELTNAIEEAFLAHPGPGDPV